MSNLKTAYLGLGNVEERKTWLKEKLELDASTIAALETAGLLKKDRLTKATYTQLIAIDGISPGDALEVEEEFTSDDSAPKAEPKDDTPDLAAAMEQFGGNMVEALNAMKQDQPVEQWPVLRVLEAVGTGDKDPSLIARVRELGMASRRYFAVGPDGFNAKLGNDAYLNLHGKPTGSDPQTVQGHMMYTLAEFLADSTWALPGSNGRVEITWGMDFWYDITLQMSNDAKVKAAFEGAHYYYHSRDASQFPLALFAATQMSDPANPGPELAKAITMMTLDKRWDEAKSAVMKYKGDPLNAQFGHGGSQQNATVDYTRIVLGEMRRIPPDQTHAYNTAHQMKWDFTMQLLDAGQTMTVFVKERRYNLYLDGRTGGVRIWPDNEREPSGYPSEPATLFMVLTRDVDWFPRGTTLDDVLTGIISTMRNPIQDKVGGDYVRGDKIQVGNITGGSNVRIGR